MTPDVYQYRMRATWNDNPWSPWENCSEGKYNDCIKTPLLHDWAYEVRKLFVEPSEEIARLKVELAEQTALTDKWYDRSVVLEQEKFKLVKPAALAVELEQQLQELTEILRNEREIMHRENLANAQHAGQLEYRNREAINKINFAIDLIDADDRGVRFIKVLTQLKTTLTK